MNKKQLLKFIALTIFSTSVFASDTDAQNNLSQNIGKVKSVKILNEGLSITTENAQVILISYLPDVVRVRIARKLADDFSYAVIQYANKYFKNFVETKNDIKVETDSLYITIDKNPFRISFYNRKMQLLNSDYTAMGTTMWNDEITTHKKMFADEKFIGLGEKTGGLNRRGSSYNNWNTDKFAYPTDFDPLYKTIPFYIGIHDSLTYAIFLDNSYKTNFNFGASTDEQFMSYTCESGEMNYYFFGSATVAGVIEDYTWLTGRMKMPPLWSIGYQQCRWSYMSDKEVLSVAKTFREKKFPCDVIYNDIDYMDRYRVFTWSDEKFPNHKNYIKQLNDMNFHLAVIIDPGIAVADDYTVSKDGLAKNVFATYPDGKPLIANVWPGRCNFPDFTKPATRTWWENNFKGLVDDGVEGFWNDMNEPASWGQSLSNTVEFDFDGHKTTMKQAHNVYGMQMSRATFEGTKRLLNKRPFVLTRATYAGGQRYSAVWTGDNDAYDDHMLLGVRLVNSLGLCGFAFAGPDMGGFANDATKDLFQRWLSICVFTPFFRNHSMMGTRDKEPWALGEYVEPEARRQIELRYQLLPYTYCMFHAAVETGIPVARSLALNYTNDEKIYYGDFENEYLYGDAFLIAPCKSTEKFTKVHLPKGEWYRFNDDKKYKGDEEVIVESPVTNLPVFVKGGAVIPMQSIIQSTAEMPSDTLVLQVYYGQTSNTFVYYEDDGSSYDYENGNFYKREIKFDGEKKTITFEKAEGSYKTKFKYFKVLFHGFDEIQSIASSDGNGYYLLKGNPTKGFVKNNNQMNFTVTWK
ncbi:MAG: glycoside hydrolase family 31 protein [Bacteroidia bacterium]